jgi:hypothetical protein
MSHVSEKTEKVEKPRNNLAMLWNWVSSAKTQRTLQFLGTAIAVSVASLGSLATYFHWGAGQHPPQPEPQRAAMYAATSLNQIPAADDVYSYGEGMFARTGTRWTEYRTDWSIMYEYTEFERTGEDVTIYDRSRDTYIKIPLKGGLSYAAKGRPPHWEALYDLTHH